MQREKTDGGVSPPGAIQAACRGAISAGEPKGAGPCGALAIARFCRGANNFMSGWYCYLYQYSTNRRNSNECDF